ncbi:MAG TPA: Gfo/Idh/MocA family oxidoreductase [Planctomycetota bacterium]|nr:Gfo/Idh/MocA family oxidoreductase [Planctomycetota bacterium]
MTMNRRHFLVRSTAIAGAAAFAPRLVWGDDSSKRLNIAQIGALGKGESDCANIATEHNLVAIVDCDSKRLEEGKKKYLESLTKRKLAAQDPKPFTDFRKMFDTMAKDIDAVIISTPDHTHYAAAVWALKNKKHICVQKPLCNTIWEGRELLRLSKEQGVVTQMGNQGRTMEGQRWVKEVIDQGGIGTLKEVRLWTNRPIWPQGVLSIRPTTAPANLDWDLWQSQQTAVPYFDFVTGKKPDGSAKYESMHPFKWRGWWDYGSGALGDMGCHVMDCAFSLLGRPNPSKIDVEAGPITTLTAPMWTKLVYHIPASKNYNEMTVSWHDGTKDGKQNKPEPDPRIPVDKFNKATSGMIFIGTEGCIMDTEAYCGNPTIYPEERAADVKKSIETGKIKKTERRSPKAGNPQLEFAHAIVNNLPTSSTFDYAVPLTEFVQLGNLAIRSGESISWDAAGMKVTNVESANKFVKRPAYRQGWV